VPPPTAPQTLPAERWRVFLSHTYELRQHPKDGSYVAQAERAVRRAGHVSVDMAEFPALDQLPARVCEERVRSCDVYVGIYGLRYGSPVRDQPKKSYTELEFDVASEKGMPRLIFLLDRKSTASGLPLEALIDRQYGQRQDDFLRRVQGEVTFQRFSTPQDLDLLIYQALMELAGSAGPEPAPKESAVPRSVPDLLPYLPDRHPQEERLAEALRRLLSSGGTGPLMVVLHGEEDQRPDRFRDRFLHHNLPTLLGPTLTARDFALPWPGDLSPDEGFAERFHQRIAHHLCGDRREPGPARLLARNGEELVVLCSSLYTEDWGRQGERLFEQVCRFWRESEAVQDHGLLHWVTINYKKPPAYTPRAPRLRWLERRYWIHWFSRRRLRRRNGRIRAILEAMARSSAGVVSPLVLPELESVRRSDAESWARSQPVRTFLGDQRPWGLEDAVAAFYRRWESERGTKDIPLEELGPFLREELARTSPTAEPP
jgi:hypothetical protein